MILLYGLLLFGSASDTNSSFELSHASFHHTATAIAGHESGCNGPNVGQSKKFSPTRPPGYPVSTIATSDEEKPIPLLRQMENLNRGVIAVRKSDTEAYIGWRLLGTDPREIAFNLYRSANGGDAERLNEAPLTQTTDFVDTTFDPEIENVYIVRPVIDDVEHEPSSSWTLQASAPVQQYLSIPLNRPEGGRRFRYSPNDGSVGDLTGDGQYEIVLKWDPTNAKDNSHRGFTGNVYLDAYTLAGEQLWRIDLGRNVRAGAHYTQFLVYDFNGNGRSEVVMRTADGTVSGTGEVVGDADADHRNQQGYVLTGPEYLTIFDGKTGAVLDTIDFPIERGDVRSWGDNYGNRVDRFLATVAYLNGETPSIVFARGYYGPRSGLQARNEVAAVDFVDGELSVRWLFQAATDGENREYIGQGAHSLTVGDVTGDGRDEIVHGSSVIGPDGEGLYSTTWGHGDALHLSNMDPSRPGMEIFMVHESPREYDGNGGTFRDAATGELIFGIPATNDVGRGMAADIDPNSPGYEVWGTVIGAGRRMIYGSTGEALYPPNNISYNFAVWWDADPLRELLDRTTISKWRYDLPTPRAEPIFSPSGVSWNNGSKATPVLSADIFGDWREEVIWRAETNDELRIYTTTIPSEMRIYTLMHDPQYRMAIAWQNVGYNQPPHPSFFIGHDMPDPPTPQIYLPSQPENEN